MAWVREIIDVNLMGLLQAGSHIFTVHPNEKTALDNCFSFLLDGLANNEIVLIILDDLSKIKLKEILNDSNGFENIDLENDERVVISDHNFWYKQMCGSFDSDRFILMWQKFVIKAKEMGKKGIRMFIEADSLLINKFDNALIQYDEMLQRYLDFPITSVYSYNKKHIAIMNPQQNAILNLSNGFVWVSCQEDGRDVSFVDNPIKNHCLCFADIKRTDDGQRTSKTVTDKEMFLNKDVAKALADFINDGLRQGEPCIYATVRINNNSITTDFLGLIDKNSNILKTKENLFHIVDLSYQYIKCLSQNFDSLKDFIKFLNKMALHSRDGMVRLVTDFGGTLFKNRYFEECIAFENWCMTNLPQNVLSLSIYPSLLFDDSPYRYDLKYLLSNCTTSLIISSTPHNEGQTKGTI